MSDSQAIARNLLTAGYTALVCTDEPCGCGADDIAPCDEYDGDYCVPGYAVLCDGSVCCSCEPGATPDEPHVCFCIAAMIDEPREGEAL